MNVWINEIDYDNLGTDTDEFIELAGVGNTHLTGWSIVLYNGASGAPYRTVSLDTYTIALQDDGYGTALISFSGQDNIQNGPPDGLALVDDAGNVVQFLSYEGVMTAVGGAADDMVSTKIGTGSLADSNDFEGSLQLTGVGNDPSLMTWAFVETPSGGLLNIGQNFSPSENPAQFSGDTTGTVHDFVTPGAKGKLIITDADSDNDAVAQTGAASDEGYGTFSINTSGKWTFTLDGDNATVRELDSGQTLTDKLTITSADSSQVQIVITIHGITDVVGTEGNDRQASQIVGGDAVELISALAGNDVVFGLGGGDYVIGGSGADKLFGGEDGDIFIFDDGDTGLKARLRDIIADFKHSDGDRIDLSDIDGKTSSDADDAFKLAGSEKAALKHAGLIWIDETGKGDRTIYINNDADKTFDFAMDVDTKDHLKHGDFIL